jgi:hypothetical protein
MQCTCTILSCGLPGCTIFFHIISQPARFSGGRGVIGHKMCFDFLFNFLSETFLILRRNERDMIKKTYTGKVSVIILRFSLNMKVVYIFSNNTQIQNFMKIPPVEADIHADGRTDRWTNMTKLSRFLQFCKRAYKCGSYDPVSYGYTTACGRTFEWWMVKVKVQHAAHMATAGLMV